MKKEIYYWMILGIGSLLFSSWLMFHTFSYDQKNSSMLIGVKAWSDFGAHIPLIRSFSLGNNWPLEYPLFPGEPIRYHFLFYFLVGMLEKIGLRIDWALNIPSIIGFTGLMIGIAVIAQKLFKDKRVTILSLLFFLFNGSLSFIRFFKLHPLSIASLKDIITNNAFPSFAPWGQGEISAFWNLNIYTNQRHLALAFALVCVFIILLLHIEKKKLQDQLWYLIPLVGICAVFPYFHQPMLLILALCITCYFLLFPKLRVVLLLTGVFACLYILPQILSFPNHNSQLIQWYPGYLIHGSLTISHFFSYWFQNIGLHMFLIPIGLIIAPKIAKKVFILCVLLFGLANMVQFSSEIVGNHKFMNFFLIFGQMFSAYALIRTFEVIKKMSSHLLIRIFAYLFVYLACVMLTLSGIIDFFPVYNDGYMTLQDIPKNNEAQWIALNTVPKDVFLTNDYFYQPPSIAGRPIYYGWPYFAWSLGYNTDSRYKQVTKMFEAKTTEEACTALKRNSIAYIAVNINRPLDNLMPPLSSVYTDDFVSLYKNDNGYIIQSVSQNCP